MLDASDHLPDNLASAHAMILAERAARREAMDSIKVLQKDSAISEDNAKRHEKDVQEETDKHIGQINSQLSQKEQELTMV